MLTAFFVIAFALAVIGRWDESIEGWLEDRTGAGSGTLTSVITNFLGMGAAAAAAAQSTGPALTVIGLGLAAYFVARIAMSLRRAFS